MSTSGCAAWNSSQAIVAVGGDLDIRGRAVRPPPAATSRHVGFVVGDEDTRSVTSPAHDVESRRTRVRARPRSSSSRSGATPPSAAASARALRAAPHSSARVVAPRFALAPLRLCAARSTNLRVAFGERRRGDVDELARSPRRRTRRRSRPRSAPSPPSSSRRIASRSAIERGTSPSPPVASGAASTAADAVGRPSDPRSSVCVERVGAHRLGQVVVHAGREARARGRPPSRRRSSR